MDDFFTKTNCDRCGKELGTSRIMSMYNNDCLCMECKNKERHRDDYKKAVDADIKAIKNGNYNFEGIGLLSVE